MSIITEAIIAILFMIPGAAPSSAELAQHAPLAQLGTFTNKKHGCVYVVTGDDDDLYVVATGGSHCYRHILIDGSRIDLGRRAALP